MGVAGGVDRRRLNLFGRIRLFLALSCELVFVSGSNPNFRFLLLEVRTLTHKRAFVRLGDGAWGSAPLTICAWWKVLNYGLSLDCGGVGSVGMYVGYGTEWGDLYSVAVDCVGIGRSDDYVD